MRAHSQPRASAYFLSNSSTIAKDYQWRTRVNSEEKVRILFVQQYHCTSKHIFHSLTTCFLLSVFSFVVLLYVLLLFVFILLFFVLNLTATRSSTQNTQSYYTRRLRTYQTKKTYINSINWNWCSICYGRYYQQYNKINIINS